MRRQIGAHMNTAGACEFSVWAPLAHTVTVNIIHPEKNLIPLTKDESGYWQGKAPGVIPGARYVIEINGESRPDPASFSQPDSIHEASEVVDLQLYHWKNTDWKGISLEQMIMYELHVGTFTEAGTFEGVISKLEYLKELGINAIEIMPVAQFPGTRNWGYDGVYPFAVQNSYGGHLGLQKLVDACHGAGIAVVLDVVYNHMGPEGNYLNDFGPYFTDKYSTPWGKAINFDDAYCDGVRNFFIENALMWFRDFHVDALRLDAVHAIKDLGATHFLQQLSHEVKKLAKESGRHLVLIGESDLNDNKFINPIKKGGFGLDGQWVDEFHHALHSVLTGEKQGYYEDFGGLEILRKAYEDTYVYNGTYSHHRKKIFGSTAAKNPFSQFIVFSQNHDQVGNRMLGERLSQLVSFEALKLAAGTFLASPYVPMLFMGEEYGEKSPFQYFISHTDEALVEAVRDGRKKEFEAFHNEGEVPDPQAAETFKRSTLKWDYARDEPSAVLLGLYKALIKLKKEHPAFQNFDRNSLKVSVNETQSLLILEKTASKSSPPVPVNTIIGIFNFGKEAATISLEIKQEVWEKLIDSADKAWLGPGNGQNDDFLKQNAITVQAESFILFERG